MDQFLKGQKSEGVHDSRGNFTIDSAQARRKQAAFQLARPGSYILKFVQAAVMAGASELAVHVGRQELCLTALGEHPALCQLETIANALFHLPSERSPERHLAVGLNAACQEASRDVLWQTPSGSLALDREQVRLLPLTHPTPRLVVKKPRQLFQWFRGSLFLEETAFLTDYCRYAPLKLTIDSRSIERSPSVRYSDPLANHLFLPHSHTLLDLVLPAPQGLQLHYPPDQYEGREHKLSLWSDSPVQESHPPKETRPLLIDGWERTEPMFTAFALLSVPPLRRGPTELHPVVDGVSLEPLLLNRPGLPGIRVVLNANGLHTDLSEFALVEDEALSQQLQNLEQHLLKSVAKLDRCLLGQAFTRAGIEAGRIEATVDLALELLDPATSKKSEWIENLIKTAFAKSKVILTPNISKKHLAVSRKIHTQHLPDDEPVIAFYDDTLFGSGKVGFLLTEHRICWKSLLSEPTCLLWSDLVHCDSPKLSGSNIEVAGTVMRTFDLNPKLAHTVLKLLESIAEKEVPPVYRHSPGERSVLNRALSTLGRGHQVSYHPHLPPALLNSLSSTHKEHWNDDFQALVTYDDSLMGTGRDGFVVTEQRLFWKNAFLSAQSASWCELDRSKISVSNTGVLVDTREISVHIPDLREPLAKFLRLMVS